LLESDSLNAFDDFMPIAQLYIKTIYDRYRQLITNTPATAEDQQSIEKDHQALYEGFVVCHAAMHAKGQGAWWVRLITILGDPQTALGEKTFFNEMMYKTQDLFNLVFSNVSMSQSIGQLNHLTEARCVYLHTGSTHPSRVEFVMPHSAISNCYQMRTIGAQTAIAGHFTEPTLRSILEKNKVLFKDNLCLFKYGPTKGSKQICSLRYQDSAWFFDGPHLPEGEMRFETIDDLIKSMLFNKKTTPVLSQCELWVYALVVKDESQQSLSFDLSEDEYLSLIKQADFNNFKSFHLLHVLLEEKLRIAIESRNMALIHKIINRPILKNNILAVLVRHKTFYENIIRALCYIQNAEKKSFLHVAALLDDQELLEKLLYGTKLDSFQQDYGGDTPLGLALTVNGLKSAQTLLDYWDKNSDKAKILTAINIANLYGTTPLHYAASFAPDFIETLILRGANLEARDTRTGNTPLFFAISRSQTAMRLLLKHGSQVDVTNRMSETPFHYAVCKQYITPQDLDELIARGARLEARDSRGNTPLNNAVLYHHARIKYLLDRGAKMNSINEQGETLLYDAVSADALPFIDELLRIGLDPLQKNHLGDSPFIFSLRKPTLEVADRLFDHLNKQGKTDGMLAEMNTPDVEDTTPLYHTIINNHKNVFDWFILMGADLSLSDKKKRTALYCAVVFQRVDFIKTLLAKGADPWAADIEGNTPLKLAMKSGNEAVMGCFSGIPSSPTDKYKQQLRELMPRENEATQPAMGM
jgi:ankyrin repeat protein